MLTTDRNYRRLALAWCCTWFALGSLQSAFVLANTLRLGWGAQQNGLALAVVGVGSALVQGLLVRRVVRQLGERAAALSGYALSCIGYLAFALAGHPWVLFVGIAFQSVGAVSGPSVQSMFSSLAGASEQGHIQGALASVQGLVAIIAPIVGGWAFSTFASANAPIYFPGAPFFLAAIAYALAYLSVRKVSLTMRPSPLPGAR